MTTWEYRTRHVAIERRDALLAEAGKEGWELVHVGPTRQSHWTTIVAGRRVGGEPYCELILKRPVGAQGSRP